MTPEENNFQKAFIHSSIHPSVCPESLKVLLVVVFLQVQVAADAGEVKEVSLRQSQLTGVGLC